MLEWPNSRRGYIYNTREYGLSSFFSIFHMKFFNRLKYFLSLIAMLLAMQAAWGYSAADELTKQLAKLQSCRADFVQTVMNGRGQVLQRVSGRMILQRPGRFRWEVEQPNRQLLIADGQRIWFYDIDLRQITIQKQQLEGVNSPAALLSDTPRNLTEHFIVTPLIDIQGFRLVPKNKNVLFQSITLIFQHNQLREMRLIDKLGQQTVVNFSRMELNPSLVPSTFHFIVPTDKNIEIIKS